MTEQAFFTYNADGTAEVALIGRVAKLRRPRVGQIRELRQMWEAEADKPDPTTDRLRVEIEAIKTVVADENLRTDEALIDRLNEFRDMSKQVRDRNEDVRVMWLTAVLFALDADDRTPSEEEFPGEVLRGTWPRDLINHWLGGGLPLDSDSGSSES